MVFKVNTTIVVVIPDLMEMTAMKDVGVGGYTRPEHRLESLRQEGILTQAPGQIRLCTGCRIIISHGYAFGSEV
jgi:uncharacterized protein YutE (UPF0331/DUF86 family)